MKGLLNCRPPEAGFDRVLPAPIWLFPLCEKPWLEYSLDLFVHLGIEEVLIIDYPEQPEIPAYFGSGARWGLQLHYLPGQSGEVLQETLARLHKVWDDDLLVSDGLLFPFYQRDQLQTLTLPTREVIYSLARDPLSLTDTLLLFPQPLLARLVAENSFASWVQAPLDAHPEVGLELRRVHDLNDWFQLQLDLLARGADFDLALPAEGPGRWRGRQVQISPQAELSAPLWLGHDTTIAPEVHLRNCLISGQVRLERETRLEDCVVLGPSYLQGLTLTRALIIGERVLDPLTGESVPLETAWPWREQQQDPEAVSRSRRRDQDYAQHFLRWRRPLFALLARFCQAEVQTFLRNEAGDTLTLALYQPRTEMTGLEKLFFALHLERVPLLEAVAAGQLALIGNRLQPEGAATRAFVRRLPVYVPGVLSWNQEPQCDTRAWLSELAWCNRASDKQEVELLAQWDGRN